MRLEQLWVGEEGEGQICSLSLTHKHWGETESLNLGHSHGVLGLF